MGPLSIFNISPLLPFINHFPVNRQAQRHTFITQHHLHHRDHVFFAIFRNVFYNEGDVERIAKYCEKDVVAVMQLMLRYKRLPLRLTVDGEVINEG